MANKYYAIRNGKKTGIFNDSWDNVKPLVNGYPSAVYKGFKTKEEAEEFMGYVGDGYPPKVRESIVPVATHPLENDSSLASKQPKKQIRNSDFKWDEDTFDYSGLVAFTDGSVKYTIPSNKGGQPEGTSFGLVVLKDGVVKHLDSRNYNDDYNSQRNVAGELRGVIAALTYAKENNYKKITICFDYIGIALWVDDFHGVTRWQQKKPLVKAYVKTIEDKFKDIDITFVKVPAHSGAKYNELADELAKHSFDEHPTFLRTKKMELLF